MVTAHAHCPHTARWPLVGSAFLRHFAHGGGGARWQTRGQNRTGPVPARSRASSYRPPGDPAEEAIILAPGQMRASDSVGAASRALGPWETARGLPLRPARPASSGSLRLGISWSHRWPQASASLRGAGRDPARSGEGRASSQGERLASGSMTPRNSVPGMAALPGVAGNKGPTTPCPPPGPGSDPWL